MRSSNVRFDKLAPELAIPLPLPLSDVHPPKPTVLGNRGDVLNVPINRGDTSTRVIDGKS